MRCCGTSPGERYADRAGIGGRIKDGCEIMKTLSGPLSQKQNPNRVVSVEQPGLDLLEKDEVKAKRPSMWNIVKGIAGTYTFEVAEQKQSKVLLMAKVEEHPLRVEVERV